MYHNVFISLLMDICFELFQIFTVTKVYPSMSLCIYARMSVRYMLGHIVLVFAKTYQFTLASSDESVPFAPHSHQH